MIGIIGSNGEIGRLCIKLLEDCGIKNIKAGVRNRELLKKTDINYEYIDLLKKESCIAFVSDCDIIINCALSNKTGIKNLVEAVELNKIKLIDLTYYRDIVLPEIKHSIICHGVGSSPGLTELLPRIISENFDEVESLNLYYLIVDSFTYSAAKEYHNYITSEYIYPMSVLNNGKLSSITSLEDNDNKEIVFNERKLKVIPYMDIRALETCRKLNIKNAQFNICIPDGETYKLLTKYRARASSIEENIFSLIRASREDCLKSIRASGFIVEANGKINGIKNRNNSILIKSNSAAKLSALIVIAIFIEILNTKHNPGIYNLLTINKNLDLLEEMSNLDEMLYVDKFESSFQDILHTEGEI